jgi:hypothetical protein
VQQGIVLANDGVKFNVAVPRAGFDREAVVVRKGYAVKAWDASKADNDRGIKQALAHPDDQGSSAGDGASFIAMALQQRTRFFESRGFQVIETVHYSLILTFSRKGRRN